MRKSILIISAVMMLMACEGQSKKETAKGSDNDSTAVADSTVTTTPTESEEAERVAGKVNL